MDPERKEEIAQEKFDKSFDELGTNEKKAVGGEFRKQEMGGSEGYSEMGKKGGSHTKADDEPSS
jgi:general stress protein YciG